MAERLPLIRELPRHWLDWWGHNGGSAEAVAAVLPQARRQVIEPTEALAEISRRQLPAPWWRMGARAEARRQVRTEPDLPVGEAQMVWANMMLHHAAVPVATLGRWHSALATGGFLMFSTFGPDSLRELREVYSARGWPMPHRPFMDMHDIGDLLVGSGFADPVMDQERIVLSWSSPQALLDELRSMGHRPPAHGHAGLRTPRWREQLQRALAERADTRGRIHLGFEVVYGHAFKAEPRPGRNDPATVPLEAVRLTLRNRRRGAADV